MWKKGESVKKVVLFLVMMVLSTSVFADWFFRGTPNNWGTTQMTQVSGSTTKWETTQDFTGNTNPRFKIDRYGDWKTAYPSSDYGVAAKKYKIVFDSSNNSITVSEVGAVDKWYFRGTPNNWGTTEMTQEAGTTKWKTTQDFTGNTNPRFKIDHKADWTEAYPSADYGVAAKKYDIVFDSATKAISVTESGGGTTVPAIPSGITAAEATKNSMKVSWGAVSGATSYTVYYKANISGTYNYTNAGTTAATSFVVTGLTPNTSYSFAVTASNSAGTSAMSSNATGTTLNDSQPVATNGTMMQYFEWYLPADGTHWDKVKNNAAALANMGITALWLPPAYKGDGGGKDVGYGVYDIYDMGEFDQKGSVRTKYGTKQQYADAINALHANNIQVYADIVLNHKAADATEYVQAHKMDWGDRNKALSGDFQIQAWTKCTFPGRGNTYSSFKWNASHFNAVDWNQATSEKAIFQLQGKTWDWEVDTENGNYDYLMYADIDFDNGEVVNELKTWGKWYVNTFNLDGFRLDAVKHIKFGFYPDWLGTLRTATGKELFAVGEYWNGDLGKLSNYITKTNGALSLFDVPLHYRFQQAANGSGGYDMRYILDNTLMSTNPTKAVTFVDNHDTQPGQSLASPVADWFKPIAYALILLRQEGYPNVFYGDLYGAQGITAMGTKLSKLIEARKNFAYGTQNSYFDDANVIGWTRTGDTNHPKAMAVVVTDGAGGSKYMNTGKANATFYDYTGNRSDTVTTNSSGWASFPVNGGSVSVWVQQ